VNCPRCTSPMRRGTVRCDACGAMNLAGASGPRATVPLSEVPMTEIERLSIGIWDPVFGGGIAQGTTALIGGDPGTGKSTMCLLACDAVSAATGRKTVYVAAEQALKEIKLRDDQLSMRAPDKIEMLDAMGAFLEDVFVPLKPALFVIDSLSALFEPHADAEKTSFLKGVKVLAVRLNAPGLVITHATKSDNFAGCLSFQHDVDACLSFHKLDGEGGFELGTRCLQAAKNRNGPSDVQVFATLGERGFTHLRTYVPGLSPPEEHVR
jgi:DNA repair protein RadA/Sms